MGERKKQFLGSCFEFLPMTYSMEIKIIQYSWVVVVSFKLMFHGGKSFFWMVVMSF